MRISLLQAINYVKSGQVVAVPTETVYGLAAGIEQGQSIEQIFRLKGRPLANPLIIHMADVRDIQAYVTTFPPGFEALAEAFWPGAMTCILPAQTSRVPSLVRAGLPTAGFRIPALELTHHLLQSTGPLVMPSANLSGRPSATSPQHVEEDFGSSFPVLEGGMCLKGIESTILAYQEEKWVIARLGALAPELFQQVLGYLPPILEKVNASQPLCPGQLFRHYAPRAKLFLGHSADLAKTSFILGFRERTYPAGKRILLLGSLTNPHEVAENLYRVLRHLDQEGAETAWIDMDFPREGLWQTLVERLSRAAEKLS